MATDLLIEKVVGLSAGCVLLACEMAGLPDAASAALGLIAPGLDVFRAVKGVGRQGLESRRALDATRRRVRKALSEGGDFEPWVVAAADSALEKHLAAIMPDRDALVQATFDPAGFPVRATALILDRLAEAAPEVFGPEGPSAARAYAAAMVEAALRAALETPDYFKVLEPHLTATQNQVLAQLREASLALSAKADAIKADTESILGGQRRQSLDLAEIKALIRRHLPDAGAAASPMAQREAAAWEAEVLQTVSDYAAGRLTYVEALSRAPRAAELLVALHDRVEGAAKAGASERLGADFTAVAAAVESLRAEQATTARKADQRREQGQRWARRWVAGIAIALAALFAVNTARASFHKASVEADTAAGTSCFPHFHDGGSDCYDAENVAEILKHRTRCAWLRCETYNERLAGLTASLAVVMPQVEPISTEAGFIAYCLGSAPEPATLGEEPFEGMLHVPRASRRVNWGWDGAPLSPWADQGDPFRPCSGVQMPDAGEGVLIPDAASAQYGVAACQPIPEAERQAYCAAAWPKLEADLQGLHTLASALLADN